MKTPGYRLDRPLPEGLEVNKKYCSECNAYKNLDEFGNHAAGRFKVRASCKDCKREHDRVYSATKQDKDAARVASRKQYDRYKNTPLEDLPHGKYATYTISKCRCDECLTAYGQYLERKINEL